MRRTIASTLAGLLRGRRVAVVGLVLVMAVVLLLSAARAAISYVASSSAGSGIFDASSLTISKPSGTTTGDVMVAVVANRLSYTMTAPSGWTQRAITSGAQDPGVQVFTKVATAGEPGSYTFSLPIFTTTVLAGTISTFRGVDTASPIAAIATQANASSGSATAPSITPGVANSMLVSVFGTTGTTASTPSGMSTAATASAATFVYAVNLTTAYQQLASSAATGTRVSTLSGSDPSNGISLALRPAVTYTITGTVFEDVNYGGGAGRSMADASGVGRSGATVELYNASGSYLSSTTTAAGGTYSFTVTSAANYYVRVVNSTVGSSRAGASSTLRAVQTFRTDASSGTAAAVTDYVGGTNPSLVDPGTASSGAALNTSTAVFSAGLSGTAQSFAAVNVTSGSVSGVDFGFNFDTVVNTNDSGAGSLRQVLTNADTLSGDASLAQSGRTAGIENVIFMISNGSAGAGLRSSNNYFTTAAGSYNVATIAPTSVMPTLANALVIDAQAQPGWSSAPVIEVNGTNAGNSHGLIFNGAGTIIRGLIVNRYQRDGLHTDAGAGHIIQGNYLGTNAAGSAAAPNGLSGININSTAGGHLIGGSAAHQRNVLSGNTTWSGITIGNGSGVQVIGNYIGASASGNAAIGNGSYGVWLQSGGSVTVDQNVIVANGSHAVYIQAGSATITRNFIGVAANGTTALGNGSHAVLLTTGSNTVGGSVSSNGNTIANNAGDGVVVTGNVTGNAILGNSIYANGGQGIDLADDGSTANDGARTTGQPNLKMDFPVFTAGSLLGTTLTVSGYVGSAANQATFASSRVEIFVQDPSASSNQGKTLLGTLTTDASGNFSGTFTGVSGVTGGSSKLTATATDGSNNTSEFGTQYTVLQVIAGTVFEDVNYGGGAGRNKASALADGGAVRPGARVELYTVSGTTATMVTATTTDSSGNYAFNGLASGNYAVRVVSSTVTSSRTGALASLIPVTTYRAAGNTGTAVDVTNEVGGSGPSTTLYYNQSASPGNTSTTLVSYAEAFSLVTLNGPGITGIDFGYNFDTVTNLNDSGQGSLRQALINANTLTGDSSLAVQYRTAGIEHIVFMISNGTTGSGGILGLSGGLRSTVNYFGGGIATISPATALPAISTSMVVDGQTQPGWTANPIIELNGTSTAAGTDGLTLSGTPIRVRGFVINRFKRHGIYITGASATVHGCWIGLNSAGSATSANGGSGIYTTGSGHSIGSTTSYHMNVVSGNAQYGIVLSADAGTTGNSTVTNNYIGTNVAGSGAQPNLSTGIYVLTTGNTIGGSVAGAGNLISGNAGIGVQLDAGSNTVQGNVIGLNVLGTGSLGNGAHGIYVGGGNGQIIGGASSLQRNVIGGNTSGIFINAGGSNTIQGNYIGTNVAGTASIGNTTFYGIELYGSGSNTVGGTAAGAGNLISGQTGAGKGGIYLASNSNTVQGNLIGTNASATLGMANAGPGIAIAAASITGNTIGGATTGAANTIAFNTQQGVVVGGASSTGNKISRNAIYSNTGIGIDIAAAGRNANNGTKNATLGNQEIDTPVISSATINGSTLAIAGYVGSAAGQSTFAGATVEIFKAVADASGYGQGQTYIGSVTADASGNFNSTLTVSGVSAGDVVTTTATDASGNTSEFSANFTLVSPGITGTVFEDLNYGGGAGRSQAASGGVGVSGARVELYNTSGTFVSATTTASDGSYTLTGISNNTAYFVRVVNSTVLSSRSGSVGSLVPVMTWRTEVPSGSTVAVTDEVGGMNPVKVDAAAGAGGTSLWTVCAAENATCTFAGTRTVRYGANGGSSSGWVTKVLTGGTACSNAVFGDPLSGIGKSCYLLNADYQSVATVRVGTSGVSGVDFGFNFDTVVNVNDSGQGSLRQAITNANTLGGDASLAQSGRTAGIENLVFMISNGSTAGGLRSGYNYFSSGVATISPTSALPDVSAPLVLDAQTQPGWTANPIVELNGTSGGGNYGLTLAGGGSTVRGFVINRWAASGMRLSSSGNTVQGCWIGLNATGTAASANSYAGIHITTGSNQIGGTTATTRNVISGNGSGAGTLNAGLLIGNGAGSNTIQGNYIGLNAAGTAAVANLPYGVDISSASNTLGGTAAGAGNVMSGNSLDGAFFRAGADGNTIRGNLFGSNAANGAAVGNGRAGLTLQSNNNTVGGTGSNAANVVRGNALAGIAVTGSAATGNDISANSIFGNGGIGIDLADNGLTANDGAKTAGQPNLLMDDPVIAVASLSGTTLTVSGHVGSAAGQSTFAGARVEVFISDGSNPNGQGQTYLGALTADASGNFSGNITGVSGVTAGTTQITATATDGSGNTSEFGPNVTLGFGVSGKVFEDINYGGGAGRDLVTSGGAGVSGATVELYGSTGVWLASTTTLSDGSYSFNGLPAGSYHVRVVSASVLSTRSGSSASLVGVLTYRGDASSGSVVAVTDAVGGSNPALVDPGAGASGATFNTTTLVYSAGLSGTAQAVAPVTVSTGLVTGLDFGFNFDTVVNTSNSGQGSLRQAITNANALGGDASLAQSGRAAGIENLVFMIPNGTAAAGLRSGLNAFSGGVASIVLASTLPTISTPMVVDARTQPGWTSVPIVELNGNSAAARGHTVIGGGSTVAGFVINRCTGGGIYLAFGGGNTVAGNYIGTNAAGTAASSNGGIGVYIEDSPANTLGGTTPGSGNVISGSNAQGVAIVGTSTGNIVRGNIIGLNAAGTARLQNGSQGLYVNSTGAVIGGTSTAARNVIAGNYYENIKLDSGSSGATVQGNYIGVNASGGAGPANGSNNILVASSNNTIGGTAAGAGNLIAYATGRGVVISGAVTGNAVLGNSIFGNSVQGIDLGNDGINANDGVKTVGQPNQLMDTPVFTAAGLSGTTLTVTGYIGSAADQSGFAGARVEVFIADGSQSAGQGQTYLGSLTADANGNFSGIFNGVTGATNGTTKITATATDGSSNTSEFGPNVTLGPAISGVVYEDANYGGGAGRSLTDSGGATVDGATVELYNSAGIFVASKTTANGGAYAFSGLAAGNYYVRVVGSTVQSQRSGGSAALRGVLTWRSDASSGEAVDVTNHVGGTNPALTDPGAASSGATFNTSTLVYSAGLVGTAQNVTPVTVAETDITGLDFGFNFNTVVSTADSGPGSLRQVITNANTLGNDAALAQSGRTAGVEHLVFMIPNGTAAAGLRSTLNQFVGGVATINPTSALPTVSATLVIDAQTQPGWTQDPLVELNGSLAGAVSGLTINASSSVLRGFVINRFGREGVHSTSGSSLTIQGCWIGLTAAGTTAAGNANSGIWLSSSGNGHQIGGTTAAQRNVLSGNTAYEGLAIAAGTGHVVQGNYIGTNVAGSAAVPNGRIGILIYDGTVTIGGTAAGAGNLVSGNADTGITVAAGTATVQGNIIGLNATGTAALANGWEGIALTGGSGHLVGGSSSAARNVIAGNTASGVYVAAAATVLGNYIGTNAAGTVAIANQDRGVYVVSGSATVGGTAPGAGNLISGNTTAGVALIASASGSVVLGNSIGLNAAGTSALPNGLGVDVSCSTGCAIGGTTSGAGNTISGNSGVGVRVNSASQGNAILGNAIHGNGGLGIDLGGDGASANDGAKTIGAGNLLMDSPVISAARATGNQLVISGYVGSTANQATFGGSRIEFFISDQSSSAGQGKTWLGTLTTDANGNFSGTVTLPMASLAFGSQLTATATDSGNNTSEFGANFSGLIVDLVVNDNGDAADANVGDGSCLTAGGVCTLRAAIAERNAWGALANMPSIVFAIPGCSSYGSAACRITPATALPSISHSVLLDASTQTGFNTGSAAPIIEIDGVSAPGGTTGLVVAANNSTVRGLSIGRFASHGITLSGSGNSLLGNRIGLAVASAAAAANGGAGAYITGSGAVIGSAQAADRNVIAANGGSGILLAVGNATVTNNFIGTDANGTSGLGNSGAGVYVSTGLGGVTVSGNTIAGNGSAGITVAAGATSLVRMQTNAMSGNGGLGIDLGGDGVTANTGASDGSKPNNGINQPVITGAGLDASSMTVYGYIGTGTGQAVFAGARVDFYKAAPDPSGYGEGQVFIGFLTADANGRFSGTISLGSSGAVVGDVITATATDAAGRTSEFGPNWTSTTVAALTPGSFNAFDSDAAAGALTYIIRSKIAGAAANFAVIALDSTGAALHPGFTGTVSLSWVDARDDSGAVSGSCRASWVTLGAAGSAGSAVFNNSSRVTVSLTPPPTATRVMRLKMTYSNGGPTTTACSNDAFAALPASLSWTNASDSDSSTAGTTRVLGNTAASGGVVHRAGRPFTVRAQALDATGALMTGYDGTPVLAAAGCLLPSGCTAATLTAVDTAAVAGLYTHSAVSYAEVGAVQLQLTDSHYADVDTADTAIGVRTLTSALLDVGRFIPDNLDVGVSTNGQLATANATCLASGQGATFIGQGFGWSTTPQLTVTARNAAGVITTRWTGSLMKLAPGGGLVESLTATGLGAATLSTSYGAMTVQDLGGGQARVTASSSDRFLVDMTSGSVQDSVTPTWTWNFNLSDSSEAAVAGNPTLTATASQGSLLFNSGGVFHNGRLSLSPGYGDVRTGPRLLVQLQRYTSAGWITMTEDQGCVTVQPANVGVESPVGVFTTLGACAAPMQAAVTTRGGRAWIAMAPTPAGAPGRLTLRLAGDAATGSSCTTAGASAALLPMGLPWLLGGTTGTGPQAWATWGTPQRDALLRRETW